MSTRMGNPKTAELKFWLSATPSGEAAAAAAIASATDQSVGQPLPEFTLPRAVYLMRHAEKPDDSTDPDLSSAGKERAEKLVTYIPTLVGEDTPLDYIFAAAASKYSNRSVETVTPLAEALHLAVDDTFADAAYAELAEVLRSQNVYAGKTVLICWHHEALPALARALGATQAPARWPEGTFDRLWKLAYATDGLASLTQIDEPF